MTGKPIPAGIWTPAVRAFWDTRLQQAEAKRLRGVTDQGTRGTATGGQHLNGFLRTIAEVCVDHGVPQTEIYAKTSQGTKATTLPGFFRVAKDWDMLFVREGRLIAAIETKSIVGSFGNNYNNRSEEAIGSAVDVWTAYREKAFNEQPPPFLGYLFVLSDESGSRTPIRERIPHFPVFPEFAAASYAKRLEELCRRLVRERLYNAACFILTAKESASATNNYVEPASDLSAPLFFDQLLRAVVP